MESPNTWGRDSISSPFTPEKIANALKHLGLGISPGLVSIFPEFTLHAGSALKTCLSGFFTSCMRQFKIPRIWGRALVVTVPKPNKPLGNSKSFRPITPLFVLFKILDRLTYACVKPIIDN